MNKKTHKYVALLTMLAMVICTMFCTNTTKAGSNLPWNKSEIAETSTCVVNGVERILIILTNNDMYLKVGNDDPIYLTHSTAPFKFDKYGTLWCIETDDVIYWKSYDFGEIDVSYPVRVPNNDGYFPPVEDVESFIFDTNGQFVIGFKLMSGDSYYTYTADEIKSIMDSDRSQYPDLRPIPSSGNTPTPTPSNIPTPTPTVPAATPTIPVATPNVPISPATPTPTVSPIFTPSTPDIPVVMPTPDIPVVTPTPVTNTKISVTKKGGYNCLSLGSKITSKYKLTKGKLAWKGSSKSKKYSGVKSAAFIKKSGNLVFLTKKGKVYTLSSKGTKKCIVKKNGKKLILKNKFAVKVQVGKKFINVANK